MLCIKDGCLAGIASKRYVSVCRVTGCLDAHEFFVDSTPNIDGTARARSVGGMLNRAPRRGFGAWV